MALLYIDGFDAGDMALKGWSMPSQIGSGTSPATRFNTGRWGSVSNALSVKAITPSTEIFAGVAMANLYYDGQVRTYASIMTDNGNSQQISLGLNNSQVVLTRGGWNGTVLGSYTIPVAKNVFYYLEMNVVISDTVGKVIVKYGGQTIINYTGDTKNGGTSDTIDGFGLGCNGGTTAAFDDLYICNTTGSAPNNTFLGDVRVHTLTPNGAGSSTQMTPSTGANYTTVDELPYSATDYVTGSIGQKDLYQAQNLPSNPGTIYGVQANAIAKKTDAGAISFRTAIKSGATVTDGTVTPLYPSDVTISDLYPTNPTTSSAWTETDVNNLEIGAGAS